MHLRIAQGPHDARCGGQGGTDEEGEGDDVVHPHPQKTRGLDILGDGAHGQTGLGMVHDVEQKRHQHDGHDRHEGRELEDAHVTELPDREQPVGLQHGPGLAREDHHGQALDEEGDGDGADERRDPGRVTQGPVGHAFHHHPQQAGAEDGDDGGHAPGPAKGESAEKNEVSPDHQDVAVGKVDQAQNAVDHGVANGDQRVERA